MKKENFRFPLKVILFSMFIIASISTAFAQSPNTHRYQVSLSKNLANSDVIVETSASDKLVSVAIQRINQPIHYFNSYPEVKVSTTRIGKKTLFTIYHKEQRIEAGQFDKKFTEVSGSARSQRTEIAPLRQNLEEDMQILRAVRAYDKKADVILAELAYTIVTYNDSFLNATDKEALKHFNVAEIAQASEINLKKDVSRYKADKAEYTRIYKAASLVDVGCSLSQCKQEAYDRFNECKNDPAVADKTICYNNRSSEIQTCYNNCSDPPLITAIPATPLQIFMQRRKQKEVSLR